MSHRYTTNSFIEKLSGINQEIEVLGDYKKSSIGLLCLCKKCGHQWYPTPNKLLQGRGCPKCANKKRGIHTGQNLFCDELSKKNPTVSLIGAYINGHKKTTFRCNVCGNTWEAAPYSILAGHGCPKCYHTSTSFSEQFIYESLSAILGTSNVFNRYKLYGSEVDIFLPAYKMAIEYNGWFWHKKRLEKDIAKGHHCLKHGIAPFFVFDSCPEREISFEFDHVLFGFDLGNEPGYRTLKQIVLQVVATIGISPDLNALDSKFWEGIIKLAHFNSRRKTTSQFISEMEQVNDSIEILGDYKKSNIPLLCRCKKCQSEWNATPNALLRGNGCPRCAHRTGWIFEELVSEIKIRNTDIQSGAMIIRGTSVIDDKIEVCCTSCHRIWMARYGDLLRNHGCGCARSHNRVILGINDLKTKYPNLCEEWDFEHNKGLHPDSIAARSSKKVWWKCAKCGHSWSATVASRSQGHGCPMCSNHKLTYKTVLSPNLLSNNPELASEWSPRNNDLTPENVSPRSSKKVWWICTLGHEWEATIYNRSQGSKCPYCTRKKVLPGFNDLKTTNPSLAEEWDHDKNQELVPENFLSGSHNKVWWKCGRCGHSWQSTINDRSNQHGCPKCAGRLQK